MQYQTFKVFTDEVKAQVLSVWNDYQQTVKAESDVDTGTFEVIATTDDTDRDGEVIRADGWDFEPYKKNPIVLWAHNFYEMPIGKVTEIVREDNKIIAKGIFAPTEKAQEVRKVYDGKFLNTVSVGFIPRQREANVITRAELLELSFVPVPANPNAIAVRRAVEELSAKMFKGAVESHEPPKADEGLDWDADQATSRLRKWASSDESGQPDTIDWEKYAKGFGWYDSENNETFGAYKLPHHDIIDSELKVVWRGVAAAMTALLGGRGGTDIPENDMDAVYAHLAKHYAQFEKEAPEKSMDKASPEETIAAMEAVMERLGADIAGQVVQAKQKIAAMIGGDTEPDEEEESQEDAVTVTEGKIGRVISTANRKLIGSAIEALEPAVSALKDLLTATDPDGDKAFKQNQTSESTDSEKAIASNRELVLAAIRAADKALGLTLRELKSDRDK